MPQNHLVWELYWKVIAPHGIRVETYPNGDQIMIRRRLDLPALESVARAYPVGKYKDFLTKTQIIFEEHHHG